MASLRWAVGFTRAQPLQPLPKDASMHVPIAPTEKAPILRLPRLELVFAAGAAVAAMALLALVVGSRLPGASVGRLAMEKGVVVDSTEYDAFALDDTQADMSADVNAGYADGETADVGEAPGFGEADGEDGSANVLAGAGDDAVATRESRIGEAPAWSVLESGRLADPDTESSGYPRPLATAREASLREHGEMAPPPEIGLLQPRHEPATPIPGAVTDTVAIAASDSPPLEGLTSLALRAVGTMTSTLRTDVDAVGVAGAPADDGAETADDRAAADRTEDERADDGEANREVADRGGGERADDERAGDERADDGMVDRQDDAAIEPSLGGAVADAVTGSELQAGGDAREVESPADDSELAAMALGTAAPDLRVRGEQDRMDGSSEDQPMPWRALAGLAACMAGLAVLLLARHRRSRRYR